MGPEASDDQIQKMATILRQGATMLDISCPECNNPIFKLKDGVTACVICQRKVVFGGEDQPAPGGTKDVTEPKGGAGALTRETAAKSDSWASDSRLILKKRINEYCRRLGMVEDLDEATRLAILILKLLEVLEKVHLLRE